MAGKNQIEYDISSRSCLLSIGIYFLIFCDVNKADSVKYPIAVKEYECPTGLQDYILCGYNKGKVIELVEIYIYVNWMELDEINSKLTLHSTFVARWYDHQLSWNPANHNGIDRTLFLNYEIWYPDIRSMHSFNIMEQFFRADFLVRNEGLVTWETPATFEIYTQSSLRHWPVDSRTCILFMGSYKERNYRIISGNDTFVAPRMINMQNNQWKITKTSTSNQISPFIGQYVRYKFKLQRQSSVLIVVVASSVMLSVALTFLPFCMTVLADRLKVHGLQAILSTVYMTYFLTMFTPATLETPLVVTFFSRIFCLNGISMFLSILEWNLINLRHIKVPSNVKKCINGRFFRMLRDDPYCYYNNDENDQSDNVPIIRLNVVDTVTNNVEWLQFVRVLNRFTCVVFCLLFLIFSIECFF